MRRLRSVQASPQLRTALEAATSAASAFFSLTSGGEDAKFDSTPMRSMRPAQAEAFYFVNDAQSYCRLCAEESQMPPKAHILVPARGSHRNHACREVILDNLALLCRRGYGVEGAVRMYSRLLYFHPAFPRIHGLSDPDGSLTERNEKLLALLKSLTQMGVVNLSLAFTADSIDAGTHRRRLAFERLECIGDNTWGGNLSSRMLVLFPDRQWAQGQNSSTFNFFRDACEMNLNLEEFFDTLNITSIIPPIHRERVGMGKIKADVLESIMGELYVHLWGYEPQIYDTAPYVEINGVGEATMASLVQHVLTEFYDLLILNYVADLSVTAIPLAQELASHHLWRTHAPPLLRSKHPSTARRRPTRHPTPPTLTAEPTEKSDGTENAARKVVGGGEAKGNVASGSADDGGYAVRAVRPSETACAVTGEDVLANHIAALGIRDPRSGSGKGMGAEPLTTSEEAVVVDLSVYMKSLRLPLMEGWEDVAAMDLEPEEIFYGDAWYALSPIRSSRPAPSSENETLKTNQSEMALQPYPPFLASERTGWVGLKAEGGAACLFAQSALVPPDTKPPAAGVVTEKNLHFGVYLFEGMTLDEHKSLWDDGMFSKAAGSTTVAASRPSPTLDDE